MKTFSYPLKNYCGVMQKITEKNNSAEQALRPTARCVSCEVFCSYLEGKLENDHELRIKKNSLCSDHDCTTTSQYLFDKG